MIPCRIEGYTRTLGPPENWNEARHGPCSTVWLRDIEIAGVPFMVSSWEPTPEEIYALARGGRLHLYIQGVSHPVISIAVTNADEG